MTIFGRFNNSTCKSFESVRAGLFETWGVCNKDNYMAVIKFEVNDGRGNGTGCFGMQVRADAAKFTQRDEIWSEKLRCVVEDEAEVARRVGGVCVRNCVFWQVAF